MVNTKRRPSEPSGHHPSAIISSPRSCQQMHDARRKHAGSVSGLVSVWTVGPVESKFLEEQQVIPRVVDARADASFR